MRRRYLVKPTQTSAAPAVTWVRSTPSALRVAKLRRRRRVRAKPVTQVVVQAVVQPETIANEKFLAAMQTVEGSAAIASGAASYIKKRLREESFARKILVPQYVSASHS